MSEAKEIEVTTSKRPNRIVRSMNFFSKLKKDSKMSLDDSTADGTDSSKKESSKTSGWRMYWTKQNIEKSSDTTSGTKDSHIESTGRKRSFFGMIRTMNSKPKDNETASTKNKYLQMFLKPKKVEEPSNAKNPLLRVNFEKKRTSLFQKQTFNKIVADTAQSTEDLTVEEKSPERKSSVAGFAKLWPSSKKQSIQSVESSQSDLSASKEDTTENKPKKKGFLGSLKASATRGLSIKPGDMSITSKLKSIVKPKGATKPLNPNQIKTQKENELMAEADREMHLLIQREIQAGELIRMRASEEEILKWHRIQKLFREIFHPARTQLVCRIYSYLYFRDPGLWAPTSRTFAEFAAQFYQQHRPSVQMHRLMRLVQCPSGTKLDQSRLPLPVILSYCHPASQYSSVHSKWLFAHDSTCDRLQFASSKQLECFGQNFTPARLLFRFGFTQLHFCLQRLTLNQAQMQQLEQLATVSLRSLTDITLKEIQIEKAMAKSVEVDYISARSTWFQSFLRFVSPFQSQLKRFVLHDVLLSDEDAYDFERFIASHTFPSLTHLEITFSTDTERWFPLTLSHGFLYFCKASSLNYNTLPNLLTLKFNAVGKFKDEDTNHCSPNSAPVFPLCHLFQHINQLQEFEFSCNHIGQEAMRQLSTSKEALGQLQSLKTFIFRSNVVLPDVMALLFRGLFLFSSEGQDHSPDRACSWITFSCSGNNFQSVGASSISKCIAAGIFVNLRTLNLSECSLQDDGLIQLSAGWKSQPMQMQMHLHSLNLSRNEITVVGLRVFVTAIACYCFQTLIDLDLSHNYLGIVGFAEMADSLNDDCDYLSSLQALNLSANAAQTDGILHFTKVFAAPVIRHIQQLDLSQNDFDQYGYQLIAQALNKGCCQSLAELNLCQNEHLQHLLRYFDIIEEKRCPVLQSLRMNEYCSYEEGERFVREINAKNHTRKGRKEKKLKRKQEIEEQKLQQKREKEKKAMPSGARRFKAFYERQIAEATQGYLRRNEKKVEIPKQNQLLQQQAQKRQSRRIALQLLQSNDEGMTNDEKKQQMQDLDDELFLQRRDLLQNNDPG